MDRPTIYNIEDLPVGQGLERPLHPPRKRQWQRRRSAPVPRPSLPPPPQMAEDAEVPSPALFLECVTAPIDHSRQSLPDQDNVQHLTYGSEADSSSDDDDVVPYLRLPRAQQCFLETPLDVKNEDLLEVPPASTTRPMETENILDAPPSATNQPWGLYEFDWKPFPNVPIPPKSRREFFSHSDVGPTAPCSDPHAIFIGIWDRQFMEYIASETNRYAQQVAAGHNLHPNSRITRWRETNADELYVYFGLILAMGVVVKARIEDYWNTTPDVFFTPGFSAHMSGHRFSLLNKCLHFVNNETMCALQLDASEAKLFKVQPLLSHLNNKFQSLYRLGQNIALDESLLQWKGLLDINQLIPNKAATVGIKTYEICESQTGYLWRFEVHARDKARKSPPQQFEDPMKASTPATVLRLIQGLEGKGHTLWMDNFYNSPCLARRLKVLGFDCVGTLRTNRKFVPPALHSLTKADMLQGQITGFTSGDVDVMVWRDNNRVAMISTYHGNSVAMGRESFKPILIHDYNIMMGGVDKKDQMLAMFPIERKRTKVWYKKLFRRMLNVSVLNSYIIHRQSSSSSNLLTHRNFRISLIKSLLSKHSSPILHQAPSHVLDRHSVRFHYAGVYPLEAGVKRHQRLRRKCMVCGKRVQTFCVGCDITLCLPCFPLFSHESVSE